MGAPIEFERLMLGAGGLGQHCDGGGGAGEADTIHCGVWRWPVKTGSDADRRRVSGQTVATSIAYL